MVLAAFALAVLASPGPPARVAPIPTPSEFLKMNIGGDGVLADYDQVVSYWKAIDAAERPDHRPGRRADDDGAAGTLRRSSRRPRTRPGWSTSGTSTTVSTTPAGPATGRPRTLIAGGKTIVAIQTRASTPTRWARRRSRWNWPTASRPRTRRACGQVLDNTIVILSPSHNPDGLNWWPSGTGRRAGTRFEGGQLPFLYHKYVGPRQQPRLVHVHPEGEPDLGRAGSGTTGIRRSATTCTRWVSNGARIFMPPYVDPCDPNVDPILRAEISALGIDDGRRADEPGQGRRGHPRDVRHVDAGARAT